MKPILFLDIDGVLNSRYQRGMESYKVQLLKRILDATGAEVVLSSTWRKNADDLRRVAVMLDGIGHRMKSATPIMDTRSSDAWGPGIWLAQTRGREIQEWINKKGKPDRFVILDDDQDMGDLRPFCVFTDSDVGLTPELTEEVIRRLTADVEACKTAAP